MGVGETITVINKSGKVVSNVSAIHRSLTQPPTDIIPEQARLRRLQGSTFCVPRAQG
jgi:hypothetical protein